MPQITVDLTDHQITLIEREVAAGRARDAADLLGQAVEDFAIPPDEDPDDWGSGEEPLTPEELATALRDLLSGGRFLEAEAPTVHRFLADLEAGAMPPAIRDHPLHDAVSAACFRIMAEDAAREAAAGDTIRLETPEDWANFRADMLSVIEEAAGSGGTR